MHDTGVALIVEIKSFGIVRVQLAPVSRAAIPKSLFPAFGMRFVRLRAFG